MSPDSLAKVLLAIASVCVFLIAIGLFGAVVRANDPDAEERER
jgi:hypothetical protein